MKIVAPLRNLARDFFLSNFKRLPLSLWGATHILASRRFDYRRKFLKSNVGRFSYVDPTVMIFGWKNIWIGDHTTICEDVWLNANFREDPEKKIVIGNNCHIAKDSYFSCGPSIHLKDYCFTGFKCNFLGCGHRFDSPIVPYIASGLYPGGVIEIGVNCWLTGNVTVLEGVQIGHGSVIGAGTIVAHDIPPFSLAVGNPCRIIRRYNFGNNKWIDIKNWRADYEKLMPTEDDYLSLLKERYPIVPQSLITSGRRFGWL